MLPSVFRHVRDNKQLSLRAEEQAMPLVGTTRVKLASHDFNFPSRSVTSTPSSTFARMVQHTFKS